MSVRARRPAGAARRRGIVLLAAGVTAVGVAQGARVAGADEASPTLSGSPYTIVSVASGKVLDVTAWSTANGARVQQWADAGGANQRWTFARQGDGSYEIANVHSGKVLDVYQASGADGAALVQYDRNGGGNQRFRVGAAGDGQYSITAVHSGKALDVTGASTADGAQVQQWTPHGGTNQRWRLVPASSGGGAGGCSVDPNQMTKSGEGHMWGVPRSWYAHEARNSYPDTGLEGNELNVWGVFGEDDAADPATTGYVELRNLTLVVRTKDGQVRTVAADADPEGRAFHPDFRNDESVAVPIERTGDGVVVPVGNHRNFHFWTSQGPQQVDAGNIASIEACFEARLAPGRTHADRVLMQVGVDNWQRDIPGTGKPQPAIGQSKTTYVTDQWKRATYSSAYRVT